MGYKTDFFIRDLLIPTTIIISFAYSLLSMYQTNKSNNEARINPAEIKQVYNDYNKQNPDDFVFKYHRSDDCNGLEVSVSDSQGGLGKYCVETEIPFLREAQNRVDVKQ